VSVAAVGEVEGGPGDRYRHRAVEVDILFENEETRKTTINYRLYTCSAQNASKDRESLRPYYTHPSTAVNMELLCLPFCLQRLLFGFETIFGCTS
jgi:hypothetical protein